MSVCEMRVLTLPFSTRLLFADDSFFNILNSTFLLITLYFSNVLYLKHTEILTKNYDIFYLIVGHLDEEFVHFIKVDVNLWINWVFFLLFA